MQEQPPDVGGGLQQVRRDAVDQGAERVVAGHEIRADVGYHRRVRAVAIKDPLERAADRVEQRVVQRGLG